MIEKREVTLTGDSDSETMKNVHGKVLEIWVANSADNTPTDDWDLTISHANVGYDSTAVAHTILSDASVDKDVAVNVYKPVSAEHDVADGTALTTKAPVMAWGDLTVAGANMGASKIARVWLFFER